MKNTKPKTAVKKTIKPTKAQHEISQLRELIQLNYDRTTNVLHSLNGTDEDVAFLAERQQVLFYAIAVATLLGAVNFIWLCLK